MASVNPLLSRADWPPFADIRPEHVAPALDVLLADANAALERAVSPEVLPDYDAVSMVLDVAVERLNTAWGMVGHLQAVMDTPDLRQAQADNLPRVTEFSTRLGADERLYAKYKAIATSPAAARLSESRQKVLSDALRDFVLGGAELKGAARERYAAIQDRASAVSQQFGDHVMDATDAFTLRVTASDLEGVPLDVRQAAFNAAVEADKASVSDSASMQTPSSKSAGDHLLTLKGPCYVPVLQYASQRHVRETLYRAHNTRASEFGPAELDNTPLMKELLELRLDEAQLLGYPTYAHMALVTKMARTPQQVLDFVRDLARRARPFAQRELQELSEFAVQELALPELQAWDRAYASEKLKEKRYAFSSQEVKQYFTEPRVMEGLFRLVETLFGVAIRADAAPVWHESVRYYRVWRGDRAVAAFYLDPHARNSKQGGAWMGESRSRWLRPEGHLQDPVAYLVCNFAPPLPGQPALLTHNEVITLFHEFGHGLHHMLTQVDELPVSGIYGVEHDAVELPSQFMENFCWEWEVLQRLTAHVDTGAPLPRELFDRMLSARHFQSGLRLLRQCSFSLFDMRLHSEPDAAGRVQQIAEEVAAEIEVQPNPPFYRFANSFLHLFDGGYGAGYYGYAWAEVLSADAYSAFEEAGVFDPATGERFRKNILEVGGSRPALDSFKAFRGREPELDAMLRHQGLVY